MVSPFRVLARRATSWSAAFTLVAAALLTGCEQLPRTEVIVVVDTDFQGPGGIDEILLDVTAPDGTTRSARRPVGPSEPPLPASVGLVPMPGQPLGPYTVRVLGRTSGADRVVRRARFAFETGRTLYVQLDLLSDCVSIACGAEETCADGRCRSIDLGPGELRDWTGLPSPRPRDAGPADLDAGGFDAGPPPPDAGPIDGGALDADVPDADVPMDGGPVDGGPVEVDAGPPPPDAGAVDAGMPDVDGGAGCVPSTETCDGTDEDCDGRVDETFDVATDPMNCGRCGRACAAFAHAAPACSAGVCALGACDPGWGDCNRSAGDGCEVDTTSSPDDCGACGMRCRGATRLCCAGACASACP